MSYEQALTAARRSPLRVPEFDGIAEAAADDRRARLTEARDEGVRARRWLLVAAALWLLLPLDALALTFTGTQVTTSSALALDVAVLVVPPAVISLWGAWLTRSPGHFRAAILSRAIAVSNLVVALLYAISVGGMFGAVFTSLLALASARALQLLGDRGLDGADDPASEFEPVRFRGILILALIMAFADALTLLFSSSVAGVRALAFAASGLSLGPLASALTLTLVAALVMAVNVWGLARLRTWALFGNMLSNLGVAGLALAGMLATNTTVAIGLTVTAAIQLLLPVPILAAAVGDQHAGRLHERIAKLARWVVPALVIATVVMAALHFGPALPSRWLDQSLRPR